MAVQRIGISNPLSNTDTILGQVATPYLASVIITNKSSSSTPTIKVWIEPFGATSEDDYFWIVYDIALETNNSMETHRFVMSEGDTLMVRASSDTVCFSASGVPQTAPVEISSSQAQMFTNKSISGLSNTITNIANSSLINDSFLLFDNEISLGESVEELDFIILSSPNGTKYSLSVDNAGEITITPVI